MSAVFTKDFEIDCPPHQRSWRFIGPKIGELPLPGVPIRLILTSVSDNRLTFECSFIQTKKPQVWPSLLDMKIRQETSTKPFVAVSIIPTGVRAERSDATAVALMTTLMVDDEIRQRYYKGDGIPNPWGGAEAILTHMLTNFYPFTAAHAPIIDEWPHRGFGKLVDPRDGAELISSSFLCSPLKGLTYSPADGMKVRLCTLAHQGRSGKTQYFADKIYG